MAVVVVVLAAVVVVVVVVGRWKLRRRWMEVVDVVAVASECGTGGSGDGVVLCC